MPCRITCPSTSGSTLPPESTATTGVGNRRGCSSSAATAAAPAGSTSSFARSRQYSSARDSASSSTVTISSTSAFTCGNVTSPGRPTAIPSARVRIAGSGTGACAASDGGHAAAPAACTPTTRTPSGTAAATPPSRPPPPVGTSTVATSGHCSTISSPTVPWPAITSTWSNGCTSTAPVRSANARASTRLSSMVAPTRCTAAP